jgi:hypothetical protein
VANTIDPPDGLDEGLGLVFGAVPPDNISRYLAVSDAEGGALVIVLPVEG